MKDHWPEREERFAGLLHWLNLLFKPPRRYIRAQLTVRINENGDSSGRAGTEDVADIAAVIHVRSRMPDTNNITRSGDSNPGSIAQGGVEAAGSIVKKRASTDGCVSATGAV